MGNSILFKTDGDIQSIFWILDNQAKANITVNYQAALFFNTGNVMANAVKNFGVSAHSNTLTLRGVILNTQHAFRQAIVFFQKSLEQMKQL